jgi:putative zinc finger/helix-turn-helix YgiT family protein
MIPKTRKCMACRERAVTPTSLPVYTTVIEHDGRKYTVSLNDFHILQCQKCGSIVLNDATNEALSDALRAEAGLLGPKEILAHRGKLGYTQKQLAALLRISDSTLSRWETGAQIQQRAMDALMRVFFSSSEARAILSGSSSELANQQTRERGRHGHSVASETPALPGTETTLLPPRSV